MSAPHEDDDGLEEVGAALRERFHQAVSGLEAAPGTLDYLRRAVPARRRRRHAALAATALSVFAVSTGATLAARGSFDPQRSQASGTNVGNLMTTATNDAPGGGSGHGPPTPGGQDMSDGDPVPSQTSAALPPTPGSSKPPASATSLSVTPAGTPSAGVCQNSSMSSVVATQNGTTGGVTYETFVTTVKTACTLAGMPALTVLGADGTTAKVPIYKADPAAAPLLPTEPSGQTLTLRPGDRYEFQLAWVPLACPTNPTPTSPPSSPASTSQSPTATSTSSGPSPSGPTSSSSGQPSPSGTPSSSATAPTIYSVGYSVYGPQPAQSANFMASCGASVYVTDYFQAPGQRHASQPATSATTAH
ncbi:hypothetical protein KGQ19_12170 [Catenulispora sp. NL8]|uniref:DUF4232 domain-containing protein n=1 Tax=Catenulispora pinistramenti TaxID=2705254 RepID=A0ABS5KNQ1_9ACTN|nr:hypothetical protein [Catenulispora pinistramenti]MBS2547629.1 hypothetical protein [Catenulispora pinistramenti]